MKFWFLTFQWLLDNVITMQINIEQLKKDGQKYIDSVIGHLKEEAWENLKFAKLQHVDPEALELMKNLWSHGFTKGAEFATQLLIALHSSINKK